MSKDLIVNEIHKYARKNFLRRNVILKDIDDLWQADLIDMQSFSKENSQYKYILTIIDAFSKYAWVYPLKHKNQITVTEAFKKILLSGRVPKNLQTDLGKEFYNSCFKHILEVYDINHYSTYSTKKASIVERFIRTLKSKLYKQFSLQGNYKWNDGTLDYIVKKYNSTFHRTIGMAPDEVNKNNKTKILQRYKSLQIPISKCSKFKVGDYVRISKYKGTFEKGYTPNWSTEIFRIAQIQNTRPITYLLKDARQRPILGAFYTEELQKTCHPDIYLIEKVLKRKGNQLYVKWLGLPLSENSWINKTNVL